MEQAMLTATVFSSQANCKIHFYCNLCRKLTSNNNNNNKKTDNNQVKLARTHASLSLSTPPLCGKCICICSQHLQLLLSLQKVKILQIFSIGVAARSLRDETRKQNAITELRMGAEEEGKETREGRREREGEAWVAPCPQANISLNIPFNEADVDVANECQQYRRVCQGI